MSTNSIIDLYEVVHRTTNVDRVQAPARRPVNLDTMQWIGMCSLSYGHERSFVMTNSVGANCSKVASCPSWMLTRMPRSCLHSRQ